MTTQELAQQEQQLVATVLELYHLPSTPDTLDRLNQICAEYKNVHLAYAKLSGSDIEALKRGLFIQWYSMTEPTFLTGIGEIDPQAGEHILKQLNELINTGLADNELTWMLKYYLNWPEAFESYAAYSDLDQSRVNIAKNELPETIDRRAMMQRGQLGIYWNSLNGFTDIG